MTQSEYNRAYYQANKKNLSNSQKTRRANNRDIIAAKDKAYYKGLTTSFVVYRHSNDSGDLYIGSGTNLRPYQMNQCNRNANWHKSFNKDTVKVEILHTYSTKTEAQAKESELIKSIGLSNLVNII